MVIYKITNKVNGKIYIGCTILPIEKRFNAHYWKRNEGDTSLKRAFNKYGKGAFEIVEIDQCIDREDMFKKEKYWIATLGSMNNNIGYNLNEGGACLGRSATITEKEANRRINIGKICLPETRSKISASQKGIKRVSTDNIKKAALNRRGKKQSKEHIENARLARVGYKHSQETKDKIVSSNLGKKRSDEARSNISKARRNYINIHPVIGEHIICLNNGKVYLSHKEASVKLGIGRVGITRQVNGHISQTKGYRFQVLTDEHLIF